MDEKIVAVVEKNKTEEVRIRLVEYRDKPYLDIRVFVTSDATGTRLPTKKGVTLAVWKTPALVAALQEAEHAARAAGLIGKLAVAGSRNDGAAELTILDAG